MSPLAALINHSCVPNAAIVFPRPTTSTKTTSADGKTVVEPILQVVALRDIPPGTEVRIIVICNIGNTRTNWWNVFADLNIIHRRHAPDCSAATSSEGNVQLHMRLPRLCPSRCRPTRSSSGLERSGVVPEELWWYLYIAQRRSDHVTLHNSACYDRSRFFQRTFW